MKEKLKKQIQNLKMVRVIFICLLVAEIVFCGIVIIATIRNEYSRCTYPRYTKVEQHNQPFLKYEGKKLGAEVKTLISIIEDHNCTRVADSSEFILVKIGNAGNININETNGAIDGQTGAEFNKKFADVKASVKNGKQYIVTFGYDPNTGYIIAVGIEDKNPEIDTNKIYTTTQPKF